LHGIQTRPANFRRPSDTCGFINSNAYQWRGQLRVHEPVDVA
jgi:hypothetical protein